MVRLLPTKTYVSSKIVESMCPVAHYCSPIVARRMSKQTQQKGSELSSRFWRVYTVAQPASQVNPPSGHIP